MTTLRLERTWGSDAGRFPGDFAMVALTNDPAVVYAFGRDVLRTVDARTGETLREHRLPELVCTRGRVVVSCAGDDGAVLVGAVDGDGAVVHLLALADGAMRPLFRTPWKFTKLDRIDGDPRVIVDGGTIVDPRDGAWSRRNEQRWFSRDLRWCVREELGAADDRDETIVRLWFSEVATGNEWELGTTTGRGGDATFSDDGKRFWRTAIGRDGAEIKHESWSVDARRFTRPARSIRRATRYLAVRDDREAALMLDGYDAIAPRYVADGAVWSARASCVSPDGRRLARDQWGVLRVTDLTTGADLSPCDAHCEPVSAAAFSGCGTLAATSDERGDVVVWSLADGGVRWRLEAGDEVSQLAFSPDARTLYGVARVSDGGGTALRSWDVREGVETTPAAVIGSGASVRPPCFALSPDGARALMTTHDIWNEDRSGTGWHVGAHWIELATWQSRAISLGLTGTPTRSEGLLKCCYGFSSDGAKAWALFNGGGEKPWNLAELDGKSAEVMSTSPWRSDVNPRAVGFERVLCVRKFDDGDFQISVHPIVAPTRPMEWRVPRDEVYVAALGPTMGAVGGYGSVVHLLSSAHLEPIAATIPSTGEVTALALSRDERRLLVGAADGRVHLYAIDPGP